MKQAAFVLARNLDPRVMEFTGKTGHNVLAVWAVDCAALVPPFFKGNIGNIGTCLN